MIKAVGVLSVAKMMGIIQGAIGLLLMPIFLLAGLVGVMAGGRSSAFSGVASIVIAVLIPVFYAALGFVFGAIGALLYNLVAKWVGGIEIELCVPTAIQPPM